MNARRSIFFLNGKQDHWIIGRRKAIWGLPISRANWSTARARLQELGFIAGTEVLAISGPYGHFRAVIGSDRGVYYDSASAPFGFGPGNDIYPVRFELTNVKDINQDWFDGPRGDAWREPLQDVYLSKKSLYILPPHNADHKFINRTVLFGSSHSISPVVPISSVSNFTSLEDSTAQVFSQVGFRIEQLGHKRPMERVPDGLGMLSRSLVMHAKSLGAKHYFIVWDCKYDCGPNGLKAEDERAIKEYIEAYAPTRKSAADAGEFWFLIVTRDKAVADKVYNGVSQWPWLGESQRYGLLGLRVISLPTLERLAKDSVLHRQSGGDSDDFLVSLLPREFAKPYIG
jgi:hypothetical protein